jgi:RimJ/RimL family protein N-acetyltransferase
MDDASLLHAWRNDPAIRATSHDTGEIALEAHLAWMARVLADPRRRLFVGCIGGRPVGSIRWDRLADGSWEVSLYLDPGLTGLGLGRRLLARAEDWLAGHEGAGVTARATVRPDNTASARLFEQAGYLRHEGAYSKFLPRGGQPAAST